MRFYKFWVMASCAVSVIVLITEIVFWNETFQPYDFPPDLTYQQMAVCYEMRNKEKIGNYTFVNCPQGAYWDLGHGKKRWCVRRSG